MSNITTLGLACEYVTDPLGVDVPSPRLSWILESDQRGQMQSAYQILVASSEDKLNANVGDRWDSGKVLSDQSVNVAYEGTDLTSGERCYWKVRCWNNDDNAGAYSDTAAFEMGLLEESDWEGKWIGTDASIADGHIVTEGHYGDHMLPGDSPGAEEFISTETPPPLVWTGYYYIDAMIVSRIASILGKTDDAERYARLAEEIKDAFNSKWLNGDTDQYATGSQTVNLFALVMGIVPEASKDGVIRNITKSIKDEYNGHLHTGNTGTTCLLDSLTEYGYGDILHEAVTTSTYPSWGYMVEQGATTIWESWGQGSRAGGAESMIMWATVDEFFYNDLAGIKGPDYHGPGYMTPGFREIRIKPYVPAELEHASASIKTVRGMVSSGWKKRENSITLEVTIPINSEAKVSVPRIGLRNVTIEESGKVIWKDGSYVSGVAGITGGSESADYITLDVSSGSYSLKLSGTL